MGLGGRLDAVNIVDADVAVVTSIGMDHTDWLGDDRGQIAIEKAGIARPARPCVVADLDPPDTLVRRLDELGAQSSLVGRDWFITDSHFGGLGKAAPLTALFRVVAAVLGQRWRHLSVQAWLTCARN